MDERALLDLLARSLFCDGGGSLLALYVFGSEAAGRARPDSDIDLAFLADEAVTPEVVFDAAQALASMLGRGVDLVDLATASTVMRAQIIGSGQLLHKSDSRRLPRRTDMTSGLGSVTEYVERAHGQVLRAAADERSGRTTSGGWMKMGHVCLAPGRDVAGFHDLGHETRAGFGGSSYADRTPPQRQK